MTRSLLMSALAGQLFPAALHELSQPVSQLRLRLDLVQLTENCSDEVIQGLNQSVELLCDGLDNAQRVLNRSTLAERDSDTSAEIERCLASSMAAMQHASQRRGVALGADAAPARLAVVPQLLELLLMNILDISMHAALSAGAQNVTIDGAMVSPGQYRLSTELATVDSPRTSDALSFLQDLGPHLADFGVALSIDRTSVIIIAGLAPAGAPDGQ